jgi:hypothetical protein
MDMRPLQGIGGHGGELLLRGDGDGPEIEARGRRGGDLRGSGGVALLGRRPAGLEPAFSRAPGGWLGRVPVALEPEALSHFFISQLVC